MRAAGTLRSRPAIGIWWPNLLVAAWVVHYAHRTLVWPWIVPRYSRPMPVVTCASGFIFNVINGLLNGWFLGYAAGLSTASGCWTAAS